MTDYFEWMLEQARDDKLMVNWDGGQEHLYFEARGAARTIAVLGTFSPVRDMRDSSC